MAQREVRIQFEARAGAFRLVRLEGIETLSRVYKLQVEGVHPEHTVALPQILGTHITVSIDGYDGSARYIDGFVADAAYLGPIQDQAHYRITMVPWLWFLGKQWDCRIFQNLTVPEIVGQVLSAYPVADHVERLGETYEKRTYCVQYRESDLDFICRLLEDEGIAFFFEHSEGRHRLILTDPGTPPRATTGYATVPYYPPEVRARRERDHLDAWTVEARVQPGKTTLRAFDFEKPHADLQASENDPRQHRQADYEIYDYPGSYVALGHGERIARARLEELQAGHLCSWGGGNAAGLCCGARFKLAGFPRQDQNADWRIISVRHTIDVEAPRSGAEDSEADPYHCRIEVQPAQVPFRPARTTPRPVVHGPQTAIVTGPGGEEIYTDRYGRVKVQFHWDRLGKHDADTSCWVRVSNAWAGAAFGGIHIPRIGQEVIVDFLEGDPDQPIITGRVYNGGAMPPYGLPGSATQSGIKSNSSKGGGGSNELRFEDSKGGEQVYLHAQKDEAIVVEHDKTETVHHDEHITIDHDRTEHVGHDETMSVGNNRTRSVEINESVTIGGNQFVAVHGARVDTVDGTETRMVKSGRIDTVLVNEARTVMGPQEQTVLAMRTVKVTLAQSHTVGAGDSWDVTAGQKINVTGGQTVGITGDQTVNVATKRTTSVSGDDGLSVGGNRSAEVTGNDGHKISGDLAINVDGDVSLTSGKTITIKAGDAMIKLEQNGNITISGKDLLIQGSGKIDQTASSDITHKGQKIHLN